MGAADGFAADSPCALFGRRCYAVFCIVGQPWSIIMRLTSDPADTFHRRSDAASLSKSLGTRVILVSSGDTGGVYQYLTFDKGALVELFDAGSGVESLDLGGLKDVAVDSRVVFASSLRTPGLAGIGNPLNFMNRHLVGENAFVPFGLEELGGPGETVELTLEGFGPDDIERLDYVAVK